MWCNRILGLPDLLLFHLEPHPDSRGVFTEVYREDWLHGVRFIQDNASWSVVGTLRGLHYQLPPKAMGKYIRCAHGRIQDVVVDIRPGSLTYGQHVSVELTPNEALWVPAGFAHGFLALSEALVIYKCTETYSAELDCGIQALDPELGITWLGRVMERSIKDINLPPLSRAINTYGGVV